MENIENAKKNPRIFDISFYKWCFIRSASTMTLGSPPGFLSPIFNLTVANNGGLPRGVFPRSNTRGFRIGFLVKI